METFIVPKETMRARRGNKWRKYPETVLPAWVADMDFGVAPSITAALTRLTQNQEYGYAAREGVLAERLQQRPEVTVGEAAQRAQRRALDLPFLHHAFSPSV